MSRPRATAWVRDAVHVAPAWHRGPDETSAAECAALLAPYELEARAVGLDGATFGDRYFGTLDRDGWTGTPADAAAEVIRDARATRGQA